MTLNADKDLPETLPLGETHRARHPARAEDVRVISDREFSTLLDRLATTARREDQIEVLRSWLDDILRTWSDEHSADEREVLGKLGGG